MSNLIGTGFNVGTHNGEFAQLEADMRANADMGVDTIEIGVTALDLIAGGRIIRERHEALVALTKQFGFRYTVHGLVSSNFMDPITQRYQIDAAKALVEVCNSIGSEILVHHSGSLRADAIADWAILNALLNVASGASWVSFHHGGGVGIGNSLHAGQVIVADGTPQAAARIARVLTNDPGIGVARHADAGYPTARETARREGLQLPMIDPC